MFCNLFLLINSIFTLKYHINLPCNRFQVALLGRDVRWSLLYMVCSRDSFRDIWNKRIRRWFSRHFIHMTFVHDKEIFISDWSRTPRWSRWDSPTSWRVGKLSAVDSGLSGRERVSDACPRRVPCHRRALSPWCRLPIRRSCYRIHY